MGIPVIDPKNSRHHLTLRAETLVIDYFPKKTIPWRDQDRSWNWKWYVFRIGYCYRLLICMAKKSSIYILIIFCIKTKISICCKCLITGGPMFLVFIMCYVRTRSEDWSWTRPPAMRSFGIASTTRDVVWWSSTRAGRHFARTWTSLWALWRPMEVNGNLNLEGL